MSEGGWLTDAFLASRLGLAGPDAAYADAPCRVQQRAALALAFRTVLCAPDGMWGEDCSDGFRVSVRLPSRAGRARWRARG